MLTHGGFAMSFTLKFFCLQRAFLTRLLQTTGLSLALMTASAAGVHADTVTDVGANGADGASGINPGDPGQPGGDGGSAAANAGGVSPNKATAIGGDGGGGGSDGGFNPPFEQSGAPGGRGGDATATAGTISSGSAEADAISVGGSGGNGNGLDFGGARGGAGGSASSLATGSSANGNATVSASAKGGFGGASDTFGGLGGEVDASSTATTSGSGNASSTANATGGGPIESFDFVDGSNATATADASATGGGKATATAVATQGFPSNLGPIFPPSTAAANATSNAVTVNGAMAQALSTAGGAVGEAKSTAKTSLGGVSVQSTVMAPSSSPFLFGPTTTEAIAQGGSGPTFVDGQTFAISTVLTDKADATTLIDGASNVADALLGPQDEIFGTANQFGNMGTVTSTFDFRFQGDLLLGVIEGSDFDIVVNGAQIFTGSSVNDDVIDLGSNFGPNIDLTINGFGAFVIGGVVEAVPEPSAWALMLLGFVGLGLCGLWQSENAARRVATAAEKLQ